MKVKELLKDLKYANPNADLEFCTISGILEVLSVYTSPVGTVDKNNVTLSDVNKKGKTVFIDLG